MDKEVRETYSDDHPTSFLPKPREISSENDIEMADYMLSNPSPHPPISFDKLSFADVMQLADFGPKLTMSQTRISDEDNYSYYPRFQMSTDTLVEQLHMPSPAQLYARERQDVEEEEEARFSENASSVQELGFAGGGGGGGGGGGDGQNAAVVEVKNRRKRPRAMKTSEEVESQRMTHIAVERNRRKQMNEHLRVLRSLMPSSYVQRGDQASIIGGAIEFVRELEQLLQCLESQKRRRIFGGGDTQRAMGDVPALQPVSQSQQQPPLFPTIPPDFDPNGLREEMAENKSCLADIEVRLLGFDAMIKILSRRRPQQLLKTIAALEELQFCILHTNITTIEQTVLYSFNVKITGETRCTAEDIASSVHQLFSFIDASTL